MSSHLECVESHVLNLNFIQSINFIIHKKINILKIINDNIIIFHSQSSIEMLIKQKYIVQFIFIIFS